MVGRLTFLAASLFTSGAAAAVSSDAGTTMAFAGIQSHGRQTVDTVIRPGAHVAAARPAALNPAFHPPGHGTNKNSRRMWHDILRTTITTSLASAATDTDAGLPEISSMRVGELKKELESYGISTKSFLEKKELVAALEKARAEGKKPINKASSTSTSTSASTSTSSTSAAASSSAATDDKSGLSRDQKIKQELQTIANANMKAKDMKQELQSLGVSTKSFFEKAEFAKALAEARVDGVMAEEEVKAVEVEVLPKGDPGPRKRGGDQQSSSGGGGSPFGGPSPFGGAAGGGGGGSPFGGADIGGMPGGMGGIADLLKNMGGGGGMGGMGGMADILKNMGAGAASGGGGFGGGAPPGGMPDMAKVQQMMSNPKVREIMAKAQNNPKFMQAATECMSNPAAFAKYQNDPEIRDLMNELRPYIS